jgi:hypothetical protein
MKLKKWWLLIFSCWPMLVLSQPDGTPPAFYKMVGGHLNAGSIFAHSADVENTAGSVPFGLEIEFSKRLLDDHTWRTCHCYPSTGFVLGYTNYDNAVLGHGVHLAYFLEHTFLPFKKWSPVLRGAAGLGFSNRPFHPDKNPDNQSYSLPVNAFLQLQAGFNFFVGERGVFTLRAGYNHISNGGIKVPNKGINWPHLSAGYLYKIKPVEPSRREKTKLPEDESRWLKRIEVFGAYTSREFEARESLFAYGTMGTVARKLTALHTLSLAGEWHYHQEHQRRIDLAQSTASAHRAALLLGHDFLFGKLVFSQQIGVYVYDEFNYHDPLYHRWSLNYVHQTGFSFGFSLKAHRHVAEFIDLRLGFVW